MSTDQPDDVPAGPVGGEGERGGGKHTAGAATESGAGASAGGAEEKRHLPVWQESILLVAVALGLAVLIKALFVQAFYIPSESMEPGLVQNDRILVQKPSYWFGGSPDRGDVIVFADPGNWLTGAEDAGPRGLANLLSKVGLYPTGGHLVKRVIGTEGDIISCCDSQGRIMVNGKPIDESQYLAKDPGQCNASLEDFLTDDESPLGKPCRWTIGPVPKGKLFVLGDNRANSADSRAHLCAPGEDPCTQSPWVDTSLVVGKVFTLIWPQSRWRWIGTADAFADVPDDPPADLRKRAAELAER